MKHTIQVKELHEELGPQIQGMVRAIETCVHCGFCLATCPTYQVLGEEMDSPRGRITLMKAALEKDLTVEESLPYIDRCLGCLACVTSCPSGVEYGELLAPFRAYAERERKRDQKSRAFRKLVHGTLPYVRRFRLATVAGNLGRPVSRFLPAELQVMLDLLPTSLPAARPLPEEYAAQGKRRARVALLPGCVQQVLDPEINWATLRVLSRNGVEVIIPPGLGCCGALSIHSGEDRQARRMALKNMETFPQDVDAILTNAAGCGSGMKEYESLFKGSPQENAAIDFAGRVKDVSQFLYELGFQTPPAWPSSLRLAYHDACHLAHAQKIFEAPRRLLEAIPNISLVEIPQSEVCCGSAGSYNLEQPDISQELGKRKAINILSCKAEAVAMGNIGCMVQIRRHLHELGVDIPVYHTLQVIDLAYRM